MADLHPRGTYHNQAIGTAFENLADAFGPASAQDVYAYTRAGAEKQKAQRAADAYRMMIDPTSGQDVVDRYGVAVGLYNPNQGYYAVNTNATTQRRGQDIESGDRRYNTDTVASTSRANNSADNKRAMDVAMIAPVAKDATQFIPQSVADMYPGTPTGPRTGVIAAQPGEVNYVPQAGGGYSTLNGAPKPLNESEMKAAIIKDQMSPDEQKAVAFGPTPVEDVIFQGTKTPMTQPQRLAAGAALAPKDATQVYNWKTPDGQRGGTAVMRDNKLYDSQNGQELPAGVQVQAASAAQGKEGALGPTTANQTESNRKEAQLNVMDDALNQYETLLKTNPGIVGVPGAVRGTAQNAVSAVQEFAQAFGNVAPQAKIAEDEVKALAARIGATSRDPAITKARIAQYDIAYKWAQMQNPTGEVSRQAFERALETVSGGSLANNQSTLEAIGAMREALKRERGGVASLRAPGGPAPTAPAAAAPAAAPRPRATNGSQTLEFDGKDWVPVQ